MEVSDMNNAIGSAFLSDFDLSCRNRQTMGFWLYTNDPVMDSQTGAYLPPINPVPCEVFIGHAENPAVVNKQDFEGYSALPDMLADGWQTADVGIDLVTDYNQADNGLKAIELTYDTAVNPLSEAKQIFITPQDWLIADKDMLMISVKFDDPNAADYFYMGIESPVAGMVTVMPFDPGASGVHVAMTDGDYWKVGIDLQSFSQAPGFNLGQITAVAFGLNGSPATPIQGSFSVDDIRLTETPASRWPAYDLNKDYKVDLLDFALLANEWLAGIQP
jgi:hypothetical protein